MMEGKGGSASTDRQSRLWRPFLLFVRWSAALCVLVATVGVFLFPVWSCHVGWITRWQLVPALMAGAVAELVVLAVSVALFGRLYCSVACPLGVAQDVVRLCVGWLLPRRTSLPASRGAVVARLVILGLFVMGALFGFTGLIAPYGIFGRFLAIGIRRVGEPAVVVTIWSIALFALVMALTLVRARWWCNRVCPVGTLLGLFARRAVFHVRVDSGACVKCGVCARRCDKGALTVRDDKSIAVDVASCVVCFNCVGSCKKGALRWR